MTDHDDGKLRALFRDTHEHLDPPLPPFAGMIRSPLRRASSTARTPAPAIAAAIVIVIVVAAGWLIMQGGRSAGREEQALRLAAELDDWEAPTDFLLQTPGIKFLQEAPRFGAPLDDLPDETTRPIPKEIIQ